MHDKLVAAVGSNVSLPLNSSSDGSQFVVLATANVCTLNATAEKFKKSYDDDILVISRIRIVEDLFHNAGFTIVGVQEGRAKAQQLIVGKYYTMHVAAATPEGQYGCQVWIHNKFEHEVLTTRVFSPRLIAVIVRVCGYARPLCIFSGHGPHGHDGADVIGKFWADVRGHGSVIERQYSSVDLHICLMSMHMLDR